MGVAVGKTRLCVQTSHEQFVIGSLHVTTSCESMSESWTCANVSGL